MFRTKLKIAAGVAAGAVLSGSLAFAAIPAEDGTITACYTKHAGLLTPQGSLRVVDSESQCRSYETALAWNQQGQPGPAGAAGPQGPAGPAGPQGEPGDGIAGYAGVASDGLVLPGPSKNVVTGSSVAHVAPGHYCFEAGALPFDPRSAQVTMGRPLTDSAADRIAHVFVPGKDPTFSYVPCGSADEFPVHVTIWDVSDNAYVDATFYISFFD